MKPFLIEDPRDLKTILGGRGLHRLSLYVPFERTPTDLHASELRLRAAIDRAEERLRERSVDEAEIRARIRLLDELQPPLESLASSTRTLVWLGDDNGWALATSTEALAPRVVAGQHYALRPLLRALDRAHRFRVLAVSANRVAAFAGDTASLRPIELGEVPDSLESALGSEIEGREQNVRADRPVPGARANAPVYHGHGGASDEREIDRVRFHRILGPAISAAWRECRVPVVLAAEVRTASELRQHLELPVLLDEVVQGSPDHASPEELHSKALPLVRAAAEARERELVQGFERLRKTDKALDREFDALARAAIERRIRRLWVEEEARVPGHVDEVRGRRVEGGDDQADALDALVALVLRQAGDVRVVGAGETPTGGSFCAELR